MPLSLSRLVPVLLLLASPACAQTVDGGSRPPDNQQIAAAADGVLGSAVAKQEIPGAVVTVVQHGSVIFQRGYGFASLEKKAAVDPERTLFYLASVTKPFTATAALQMVEQGKLDLQADVNTYLRKFRVDDAYPQPVTLTHLLTHTAGFDDRNIGYLARTAAEAHTLGDYLARALPPRVRPPGQVTAYSNHGYALAGYLVEVAAGKSYADALAENIFQPLGMSRTTARIPLPPDLADDLATGYGYDFRTGGFVPIPLGFRNAPPAGAVSATASDVARFLIAHLQNGRFGSARILKEETAQQMHAQQFTHHRLLPGLAFGLYEGRHHGVRLLQHAGGAPGYSALAVLVPEHGLGIFVASNVNTMSVNRKTVETILGLFLPAPDVPPALPPTPKNSSSWVSRQLGCYHSTRYSKRSIEKFAIWDTQLCVRATAAGTLRVEDRRGSGSEWVEVEPLVFRRTTGSELMAFRDEAGRITHALGEQGGFPTAFEKLPWWESIDFQLPFAISLVSVLASTITLWPVGVWVSRRVRRSKAGAGPPRAPRRVVVAAVCAGFLVVLLMAGLDAWIGNSGYRLTLVYGMSTEMVALLWAGMALSGLAILLAGFAVQSWRRGWWSLAGRIYYSLVALAAALFVIFLAQWNLLGFRY